MSIKIGFIGTGWMARAHSHAVRAIRELGVIDEDIELHAIAGRNFENATAAGDRLGFAHVYRDPGMIIEDNDIDIVAVLGATSMHYQSVRAIISAGKAVICEKPLALTSIEAQDLAEIAKATKLVAAVGFNYRFVPALALAKSILQDSRLGSIRSFSAKYYQDWAAKSSARTGWRFADIAGGSAVGDYSHIVDLMHWLCPGTTEVIAATITTFDPKSDQVQRAREDIDHRDAFSALLRIDDRIPVTLEASRVATGFKSAQMVEVVGSKGSISWNMQDLNRLRIYQEQSVEPEVRGFADVLVTDPSHPYMSLWWAPGHIIGWEHTFIHQWVEFLLQYQNRPPLFARPADFGDGYRAASTCDAITQAAFGHA